MRIARVTFVALAAAGFVVFLVIVNYPYALHWLP